MQSALFYTSYSLDSTSQLFFFSSPSTSLPKTHQFIMATTDIATRELKNPVDVAEYLFRRLHEVGIRSLHGVPGDYNLAALDYVSKCGINWVGNCNELNAGKIDCTRNE